MRNTPISPAAVAPASGACALESELLNSERIRERFGNCGIEVLQHGPMVRRSSLYSVASETRTCRSYAAVQFLEHDSTEVADAHAKILAGASIGATFKSAGWKIRKETLHVGSIALQNSEHPVAELMHLNADACIAVHAYRLLLQKSGQALHYATIIEAHHPDYLAENQLCQLYDWHENAQLTPEQIDDLLALVWT